MAGPAVVIVAGVITLWLAVRSSDGLVTDDYYKQGLAVNQVLERDHRAAALGLRADLIRITSYNVCYTKLLRLSARLDVDK